MEKPVFSFYNLINQPRFLQPTKSSGLADKQKEQDRVDIFRAHKKQVKKFPKTVQRKIYNSEQKKKLWGEGFVTHNDPCGINILPRSVGGGDQPMVSIDGEATPFDLGRDRGSPHIEFKAETQEYNPDGTYPNSIEQGFKNQSDQDDQVNRKGDEWKMYKKIHTGGRELVQPYIKPLVSPIQNADDLYDWHSSIFNGIVKKSLNEPQKKTYLACGKADSSLRYSMRQKAMENTDHERKLVLIATHQHLDTIPQKKVEFDFTKSDWIFHVLKLMLVKYGQMSSTHTTYNLLWNQLQEQTQRKKQY